MSLLQLQLRVLALLLASFFACRSTQAQPAPAPLQFRDTSGNVAVGIVCDNLAVTEEADKNYLIAEVPQTLGTVLEASVQNPDGSQQDGAGNSNTGSVEYSVETRRLIYLPPLEFNLQQTPDGEGNFTITSAARRKVVLTLKGQSANGAEYSLQQEIELARPAVVLVHGINSGPSLWRGEKDRGLGIALRNQHFVTLALNHAYNDLAAARLNGPGGLHFRGNGPVEYAASLLDQQIESALQLRRKSGFATRRVDLVAHSYGGVIARWYLRGNRDDADYIGSRRWYINSRLPGGRDLYTFPEFFLNDSFNNRLPDSSTGRDVRKLITIASPWRGVPLANLVNEVRGPAPSKEIDLSQARVGPGRLGWFIENTLPIPVNVPAMEVLAINSRWLAYLNERPFDAKVAYGAVAGNDSGYFNLQVARFGLYELLDRFLASSWFPYLGLEQRRGFRIGYSDGIVPVWSAVIAPDTPVFAATHDSILWNEGAKRYVLQALSNSVLLPGEALNRQWSTSWTYYLRLNPQDAEQNKTWTFLPRQMAPLELSGVYVRSNGVGRINPAGLREIRSATVIQRKDTRAMLEWTTLVPTVQPMVRIFQKWREPGTNNIYYNEQKVKQRLLSTTTSKQTGTRHRVEITGLNANREYFYRVSSRIPNPPDDFIPIMSTYQPLRVLQK